MEEQVFTCVLVTPSSSSSPAPPAGLPPWQYRGRAALIGARRVEEETHNAARAEQRRAGCMPSVPRMIDALRRGRERGKEPLVGGGDKTSWNLLKKQRRVLLSCLIFVSKQSKY